MTSLMLSILVLCLSMLAGALFRRWWGAGRPLGKWARYVVGFVLPGVAAYASGFDLVIAIPVAVVIGIGWIAGVGSHGDNMDYGTSGGTLWGDAQAMAMRYGSVTTVLTLVLFIDVGFQALWSLPWGWAVGPLGVIAFKLGFKRPTEFNEYLIGAMMLGAVAWQKLLNPL